MWRALMPMVTSFWIFLDWEVIQVFYFLFLLSLLFFSFSSPSLYIFVFCANNRRDQNSPTCPGRAIPYPNEWFEAKSNEKETTTQSPSGLSQMRSRQIPLLYLTTEEDHEMETFLIMLANGCTDYAILVDQVIQSQIEQINCWTIRDRWHRYELLGALNCPFFQVFEDFKLQRDYWVSYGTGREGKVRESEEEKVGWATKCGGRDDKRGGRRRKRIMEKSLHYSTLKRTRISMLG